VGGAVQGDPGLRGATEIVTDSLSIIIVHYDTSGLLRQCLSSLCDLPFEIIVLDNASPDQSVRQLPDEFPRVRFVLNEENVGFARACNQGIRIGQTEYCMLLNPDAIIDGASLQGLVEYMEGHPEAGVMAPRLVYADGSLQLSVRRFPTLRAILLRILRLDRLFPGSVDRYLMRDWDHGEGREVDWVMGACMLLRREALEGLGLLDEGFFMYYEDIDLCYRMGKQGWKVRYEPGIVVRHEHQRDSASLLPNRLAWVHLRSLVRLFRKHQLPWW
jgi:GT2 family glycosyltransferase